MMLRFALSILVALSLGACGGGGKQNTNQDAGDQIPVCGDGVLDVGEECDDGVNNSDSAPDACRASCRLPFCGDGVRDDGEPCDDVDLGGQSCGDFGFGDGALSCREGCVLDTRECEGYSAVTAGRWHTCALRPDGSARCWGSGLEGQLGDGASLSSPLPVDVLGAVGFSAIRGGAWHTCALTVDGAVWCWGDNDFGQLGDGTTTDRAVPTLVDGLQAVHLAAGGEHTCALADDASVWCWGRNEFGQLGNGTTTDTTTPVEVTGVAGAERIDCGRDHSCAVVSGEVRCWGRNDAGQLGNATQVDSSIPVDAPGPLGVGDLLTGYRFTAALDDVGALWSWGTDWYGELGNGPGQQTLTSPTHADTKGYAALSTGKGFHACAIDSVGAPACWGRADVGQLGAGQGPDRRQKPIAVAVSQPAVEIAVGGRHTCALLEDGAVWCWGSNRHGEIGAGVPEDALFPVRPNSPVSLGALAAGTDHTCGIETTHGTLWCWGANRDGQLGDGTIAPRPAPTQIPLFQAAAALAANLGNTCFVSAGRVYCVGANDAGQLGNNSQASSLALVQVATLTDAERVAVGESHACAVDLAGQAWCWGHNGSGRLGDGTTTSSLVPVAVDQPPGVLFRSISARTFHTCAQSRPPELEIYCWGGNGNGELGDGTTTARSSPTLVPLPGPARGTLHAVVAGERHSCAIVDPGVVYCWGYNLQGQLGDGTEVSSLTPVAVLGIDDAFAIDARLHTCVARDDFTVWCWGQGGQGRLGDGTEENTSTPVPFVGPAGAVSVAVGLQHTCVTEDTGVLWCGGSNGVGQIGTGSTSSIAVPIFVAR